jgi:hypothetical protein
MSEVTNKTKEDLVNEVLSKLKITEDGEIKLQIKSNVASTLVGLYVCSLIISILVFLIVLGNLIH